MLIDRKYYSCRRRILIFICRILTINNLILIKSINFFINDERAVIFYEKFLYYDNIKMNRLEDPVTMICHLIQKEANHLFLSKMNIKDFYDNLKFLGRNEEAEKIVQIS
jgi:hypothetical protein